MSDIIANARGLRANDLRDIDAQIKTLTPLGGHQVRIVDAVGHKTIFDNRESISAKTEIVPWSGFIVDRSVNIGVYRHINGVVPPNGWYVWLGGVFTSNGLPCVYDPDERSSLYYDDGHGHILVRGAFVEQRYIQPRILIQPDGRTYHVDQGPVDTSEVNWLDHEIYGTQYDDYYNERIELIIGVSRGYSYPDFDPEIPVADRPMAYDTSFGANAPACIKLLAEPDTEARSHGGALAWELPQSVEYSSSDSVDLYTLNNYNYWNNPNEDYWDDEEVDPTHARGRKGDKVDTVMRADSEGGLIPAYLRQWVWFATADSERDDVNTRTLERYSSLVYASCWGLYNFSMPAEATGPSVQLAEPDPEIEDPPPPTAVLIRQSGVAAARLIRELAAHFIPPYEGAHHHHQAWAPDTSYYCARSMIVNPGPGVGDEPSGEWVSLLDYLPGGIYGDDDFLNPAIETIRGYIDSYQSGDMYNKMLSIENAREDAYDEYGPHNLDVMSALDTAQSEIIGSLDDLQLRIEALGG